MAQVPPFGAHQWMHSIPQMMPWTLGQQPQNVVQFTGQGNSAVFQPAPTHACSPTPFVATLPEQPVSPLPNGTLTSSLMSVNSPTVPSTTAFASVKRYTELDEEVQSLQPSPKVHVTADKVTAKLSRLCIGKNGSADESLPSSPEEEASPAIETCDIDDDFPDSRQLVMSDELKSVLDGPSGDPLMGLGKQESDKICKAVVIWKPPKPLMVKVESITEVDEDENEVTPTSSKDECPDIEFDEFTEDFEPMAD